MSEPTSEPAVLLVCNDLIFTTKIVGTAKALGRSIRVYPRGSGIPATTAAAAKLVMVDLSSSYDTGPENLRDLRAALSEKATLLAYGSHVDVERLTAARAAGCDAVLPRSRFVEALPILLENVAT